MASFRCVSSLLACFAALLASSFAAPAPAATVTGLYDAAQRVQNSQQDAAFLEALKTVVVRVSGQRDAVERLGGRLGNPRSYVQRFGMAAHDVLEVGFDSVSIDRLLTGAGLPIWGHERPAVLVLLSIEDVDGSTRWLGDDLPTLEREIVANTAAQRGLPLKWPVMDEQDRAAASAGSAAALMQAATRYGANATLLGRAADGTTRWTLVYGEGEAQGRGGLEDGVHLAADTFAHVFAVSGSSLDTVIVEVSGIADLHAYANTLNYLEGMTLVRGVSLEQVSGETLRFRLAVRGDAATLQRAIALEDRLVPTQGAGQASGGGRLAFRYQR